MNGKQNGRLPVAMPISKNHQNGALTLATFALASLAARLEPGESGAEAAWLRESYRRAGEGMWRERLERYLHAPALSDRPLLDIAAWLPLGLAEIVSVALLATVEAESLAGRAVAYMQNPAGGTTPPSGPRPTVGLLASLMEGTTLPSLLNGQALASGTIAMTEEDLPLVDRPVAMPPHIFAALHGLDLVSPRPGANRASGAAIGVTDPVALAPTFTGTLRRHALALRERELLIVRARTPAEGKAAAALVAEVRGERALFIRGDAPTALGVWARSRRLLPVFEADVAPGERLLLPVLPLYGAPMVVVAGLEGYIECEGYTPVHLTLPLPDATDRRTLWQSAVGDHALAATLARDHRLGAEQIQKVGRLARHYATLAERGAPTADDVTAALRTGETVDLHALAQPQPGAIPDGALVLTAELRRHLELLLQRCRARERVSHELGAAATARFTPGVRALFTGMSGTGKTLAAGWLATQQGVPLFKVDSAGVTSKYIGETEKNLAQLLARAEASEVILLFDEADALFAKRTDIKESNDRFANAQTNFLLQRIETFDGIALLTSNSRARFDSAFTRRLDMIIEFPPPGAAERRDLWLAQLGKRNGLSPRELNHLSAVVDVAGGHIRNMVLLASVLADGRAITYADVVQGVTAEYAKLGRSLPI